MIKKTLLALAIAAGLGIGVSTQASAEPVRPPYGPVYRHGWAPRYGWGVGYGPAPLRWAPAPYPVAYHRVWVPGYWTVRPWGRVWIAGCWR